MLKYYSLRLITVLLWASLSISTFTGWRHLAALKTDDPPIWQLFDFPSQITGGLPWFSVLVICLAITYILVLSEHKIESIKKILIWTSILGLSAILAYPIGSPDLFGNAAYARLHAYYNLNPYNSTLTDVTGYLSDPFLKNMVFIDLGTPYGPLWTWVSYGLYKLLAALGLIPLLFGFKLIGLISHILITFTVYHIAEAINADSGSRAAVIYGTNPLTIFDLVVNAHNDGPAILLFLISLYLMIKRYRYIWPIAAGLAASLKLTPLIAFPFLFWKVINEKDKHIAILNIISTIFIIIFFYYYFYIGENSLNGFKTTTYGNMANSLPLLLHGVGLAILLYKITFIIFILLYTYYLFRISYKSWEGLLVSIGAGFILYYLLGAMAVHQWYYLWPLAILAAVRNNIWHRIIIYQTILLFVSYIFKIAYWGDSIFHNYITYTMGLMPVFIIIIMFHYKVRMTLSRLD